MCLRGHAVGALCALLVAGCAYTSAVPVAYNDTSTWGVRVYDVKPILLVYDNSTQIQFVPNYNRAYAVKFGVFLAKNDFKLALDNGTITEVDSKLDSTDFINLLTTIAPNLIPTPPGQLSGANAGGDHLHGVYDFVFDDAGNLVGLQKLYSQPRLPPPPADHGGQDSKPDKPPITKKS
jgi:hypothetical protein